MTGSGDSTGQTRELTFALAGVSPRLRDDVDQVRLAALDRIDAALQRGRELRRVGNRPFSRHAVSGRNPGVIDVRISQRAPDVSPVRATAAYAGHVLDEHELLMPRAVVVHHGQHGQLVMYGRPQHARRVVEIAIGLHVDDDAPAASGGESRANRGGSTIAHAARALAAEVAVGLVVVPQLRVVAAGKTARRRQTPVFVHDERPQLRVNPSGADRTAVPPASLALDRLRNGLDARMLVRLGVPGGPILNRAAFVGGQLTLDLFDDGGEAGFRVNLYDKSCHVARTAPSASTGSATPAPDPTSRDAAEPDVGGIATEQRRQARTVECDLSARRFQPERVIVLRARAGAAEGMTLRKAHRPAGRAGTRRRTDELGQLHGL